MTVRELVHPPGLETLDDFLKRIEWFMQPAVRSKFGALYLDQLDEPGPEFSFLVDGWLSTGDKSVIAGASRSGKSFFAIHIGLCVAFGMEMFGRRVQQGLVIYQAGEGARGVKKRLRAWRAHHGKAFSRDTPFVLLQRSVDIYRDNEKVKDLIDEINAHAAAFSCPLQLVVIDTLATASVGADEISGKDMGMVMDNVQLIQRQTGAHVMLVHHMNASGDRVRGHTSVYANVDQVVLVNRDKATRIRNVVLDKQKDDEEGERLSFELIQVALGVNEEGRQVTSCVCIPVGEREAIHREEELKGIRLSPIGEAFMRAFFAAEKRYGYPVPVEMDLAPAIRQLVPWDDVKRIFSELNPSDALAPEQQTTEEAQKADKLWRDTMRKRVERARLECSNEGAIGVTRDDNQTVVYWTGKALRAFPHTRRKIEEEANDDPALSIPF